MVVDKVRKVTSELLNKLADEACAMEPFPMQFFPPSIYYRFFYKLTQALQPALSVELGLCGGGGSYHLAAGWPHGQVIGVDVVNDYPDNLEYLDSHCANFNFWKMNSLAAAAIAKERGKVVDILFIDTVHTYPATLAEWGAWRGLLSDEGVVMFDDLTRPGMKEFWDGLPEPKLRIDKLHDGAGFGIVWK